MPMVNDIVPNAASNILGFDSIPSPPATHLLSQTSLLLPMMHGSGKGFLSVAATQGRHTTPLVLAVQYPASVEMVPTKSFGALSTVSLENSTDQKRDPSPIPPKTTSSLQSLVDNIYGVFFGPNECTPLRLKEIFDQEVRVVDRAVDITEEHKHHVATTTAPAVTFAQLMELTMATVTPVALISASMGSLKDTMAKLRAVTT